jgi:hypothetical protein
LGDEIVSLPSCLLFVLFDFFGGRASLRRCQSAVISLTDQDVLLLHSYSHYDINNMNRPSTQRFLTLQASVETELLRVLEMKIGTLLVGFWEGATPFF